MKKLSVNKVTVTGIRYAGVPFLLNVSIQWSVIQTYLETKFSPRSSPAMSGFKNVNPAKSSSGWILRIKIQHIHKRFFRKQNGKNNIRFITNYTLHWFLLNKSNSWDQKRETYLQCIPELFCKVIMSADFSRNLRPFITCIDTQFYLRCLQIWWMSVPNIKPHNSAEYRPIIHCHGARGRFRICLGTTASVEWQPILGGGLGAEPQWGPGAEPLVGGQRVKSPWSWKHFVYFQTKGDQKLRMYVTDCSVSESWPTPTFGQLLARSTHACTGPLYVAVIKRKQEIPTYCGRSIL